MAKTMLILARDGLRGCMCIVKRAHHSLLVLRTLRYSTMLSICRYSVESVPESSASSAVEASIASSSIACSLVWIEFGNRYPQAARTDNRSVPYSIIYSICGSRMAGSTVSRYSMSGIFLPRSMLILAAHEPRVPFHSWCILGLPAVGPG